MRPAIIKTNQRTAVGETLISVLLAAIMVGFIMLELVALLTLNSSQGGYIWSRMDNLNSVNYGLQIMGQRVRAARNLGDLYGEVPPPTAPVVSLTNAGPSTNTEAVDPTQLQATQVENGTVTLVSDHFPSAGDPVYGPSPDSNLSRVVPKWPWGQSTYTLGPTTLILQVPAFDTSGFPLALPPRFSGAPPLTALDTYVYNVVASTDPAKSGQYDLQLAYFPAPTNLTNLDPNITPGTVSTIVSGIVGPKVNGQVSVFQFVEKNQNTASFTPDVTVLQNYSGVVLNMEVLNKSSNGRVSIVPIKTEMYMRNNVAATTIGAPPAR